MARPGRQHQCPCGTPVPLTPAASARAARLGRPTWTPARGLCECSRIVLCSLALPSAPIDQHAVAGDAQHAALDLVGTPDRQAVAGADVAHGWGTTRLVAQAVGARPGKGPAH